MQDQTCYTVCDLRLTQMNLNPSRCSSFKGGKSYFQKIFGSVKKVIARFGNKSTLTTINNTHFLFFSHSVLLGYYPLLSARSTILRGKL